ncbi:nuclear pore complex protein NUP85 isoform X3 [Cryptomeria japonica]|uniref:nuclear pore complex protein NUP85 isoform X3 n=1 Tax=Cryptomeria japonica TaxID=3369 RepID=UPI0027DAAE76|nr:nuclear pore complex protein NUP85 isoform X3 [Cryptomeria japonica]
MPGRPLDALVPSGGQGQGQCAVYSVQHGLLTHPPSRISISVRWARGNCLRIAFFNKLPPCEEEDEASEMISQQATSGKVLELRLGSAEVDDAEKRRLSYASAPAFALLQSHKQLMMTSKDLISLDWWEHVMEFSRSISTILGSTRDDSSPVGQNSSMLKQIPEDDLDYWDGVASALAVGWLDFAVTFLRMHGSYQLDQLDNRQTENGLVEAVAVLILKMPRMRPSLPASGLGQCFNLKPDFVKAWDKWRGQVAILDCSAFWNECGHHETMRGLKRLIRIMLGDIDTLASVTCHWMELLISHFLYIRPFAMALEGMLSLSKKCIQLKSPAADKQLTELILGIIGDDIEVILAECSQIFDSWMLSHMIELLTAKSFQAELLLHDEKYSLGGISLQELHRLVYAQVLSSHSFTWQIAPIYLASCPRQGLGFLEILLLRQPVAGDNQLALKVLEICRLYELDAVGKSILKIVGMHHWKHGRKGAGIFWLQQARDENRLNAIAEHLLGFVGKSVSDDAFQQWEGLIDLLGSENEAAGGLAFLHKYRDFKKALRFVQDARSNETNNQKVTGAARKAVSSLMQLMRNPSTPQQFWISLLHDSVELLKWPDHALVNVAETNLLLSKLQEFSLARVRGDFEASKSDDSPQILQQVRLALATNLGRAILLE